MGVDRFQILDIQPLADSEIQDFAQRFFDLCVNEPEVMLTQFRNALQGAPGAQDLARTPLLLTMMLFVSRTQTLPDKRHQLYELCIHNLLAVLPKQKLEEGTREHGHHWCPADSEQRLRVVAALAWSLQSSGYMKGEGTIVANTETLLGYLPKNWSEAERRGFLFWSADRAGLLVDRSDGTFVFAHLSFQEYLCAVYLKFNSEGKRHHLVKKLAEHRSWWETLRLWAALEGKEKPERVDSMCEVLQGQETLWLAGAFFADGLANESAFGTWSALAVSQITNAYRGIHDVGAQTWAGSRQKERKEALHQALVSAGQQNHWLAALRLKHWCEKAGLDSAEIKAPEGSPTAAVLSCLDQGVFSREALAWGRILWGLHPLWPGDPLELCGLRLWPNQRVQLGCQLQHLLILGYDLPFLEIYCQILYSTGYSKKLPSEFFRDFARYLTHYFSSDFARDYARDFARDSANGVFRDFQSDFAVDFYADFSRDFARSFFSDFVSDFSRNFIREFSRYSCRDLSLYFSKDFERDLARNLARSYKNARFARVNEPMEDFCIFEVSGFGRYGVRAHFAHRVAQPSSSPWVNLLAKASSISLAGLGPADLQKTDGLSPELLELLDQLPEDTDPLWPALAKYIARCASPEDIALLEQRAREPELTPEGPLRWGLQFMIRGDILLPDGKTILTLDELCDTWGKPRLPLLDPMQPELEVNWGAEK